jgi:hypothetical protein
MAPRLTILLAALIVAGCGSEAPKPATVSSAVDLALTGSGPEPRCSKLLSERFVREVYGSAAACQKQEAERTDTELHDGRASAPQVTGDGATVRVALPTGASGTMSLRREGGLWKLDRYEDDLLHALFDSYLLDQLKLTASEPGLNAAGAARCLKDRVRVMGAARFRRFAYAVIGNRDEAGVVLEDLIADCLADPSTGRGGRSYLRPRLERELLASAKEAGYGSKEMKCVRRGLRSISDRSVYEHFKRDQSAAPPPATVKMAAMLESCAK